MNISLILIWILVPLLYFVVPFLVLLLVNNRKILRGIVTSFLVIYCIILCVGVFSNFYYTDNSFCVYFDFTYTEGKSIDFNVFDNSLLDALINIIMLIPVGIAIVALNYPNEKRTIILLSTIGFCVGIVIELLQFVLPIARTVQLADVLLNGLSVLIGGGIGYLYILLTRKLKGKRTTKQ